MQPQMLSADITLYVVVCLLLSIFIVSSLGIILIFIRDIPDVSNPTKTKLNKKKQN